VDPPKNSVNPLLDLKKAGQGVWLDFLRRGLVTNGGLQRLVIDDGLSGVTSNPTIFGKAIGGSGDYEDPIRRAVEKGIRDPLEMFYDLALTDIQLAADIFRPVYDASSGRDGFVSFELEPGLAHDTPGSIAKAKELFARLARPNVMIKVPGTDEGVAAVKELIAAGVNVNITLLFSVEMYTKVARAYLAGLEMRLAAAHPIDKVASVASFFVSRVDTAVDKLLPAESPLRGQVAIANAKMAYQEFRRLFSGPRWEALAAAGASVQRPLWASTGAKNPDYSDVVYIEELAGQDTVNTMPQETMDAFRDHGRVRPGAVAAGADRAKDILAGLAAEGVNLKEINEKLAADGIEAFQQDLDKLLVTIERKISEALVGRVRWSANLGGLAAAVEKRLDLLHREEVVGRIWRKDHTAWKPQPEEISDRLGWLRLADQMSRRIGELEAFAARAVNDGFKQAVLFGMGGSSLAPQVLKKVLGTKQGYLQLKVLDTTHPASVAGLESSLSMNETLFIVASKSGGTVETLSHFAHFFGRAPHGDQFVAITDPGTSLEALGRKHEFREVFLNPDDIGGRYSALSLFGLVPAALMGINLEELLDQAEEMAHACHEWMHPAENPGAWLGTVAGEAALAGRDKFTLVTTPRLASFGDWVEQLIAESTGKEGVGIVPVVGEDLGTPEVYGPDRLFVLAGGEEADPTSETARRLDALEEAGHPIVKLPSNFSLGDEFFRFEFATAVSGFVLGINPFDQPNVAEAKQATREILESGGAKDPGLGSLDELFQAVAPGDYLCLQAYLDRTEESERILQEVRQRLRARYRIATTVGFGPRFLHSTGQLHKGGPNSGIFVQIVDQDPVVDLEIPGTAYTFRQLIDAQALGDLRSLESRGRRVARTTLAALEAFEG